MPHTCVTFRAEQRLCVSGRLLQRGERCQMPWIQVRNRCRNLCSRKAYDLCFMLPTPCLLPCCRLLNSSAAEDRFYASTSLFRSGTAVLRIQIAPGIRSDAQRRPRAPVAELQAYSSNMNGGNLPPLWKFYRVYGVWVGVPAHEPTRGWSICVGQIYSD